MEQLDSIDRNILRVLQKNGRISFAELSRTVGLSATPCVERIKRLEREGIIRGYTALINPHYLKAGLVVFVQVTLSRNSQDNFEAFSQAAEALPEIQECYLVSGTFDYLLKARVADMASYRKFYGETLLTLPGVKDCTSYVVMEEVKDTLEVPVHYNR
jgi:Lrp/AsnC family leucine-responsive transcriptional regulator